MSTLRRLPPASLGGLTGLACALCCAIPLLLGVGVLGGAGWALPRYGHAGHRPGNGRRHSPRLVVEGTPASP